MVVGWHKNLATTKYEQTATLLRQGFDSDVPHYGPEEEVPQEYAYVTVQDPITGEIIREWRPIDTGVDDDPATPVNEKEFNFECQARGIMTGGLNVRGSIERWTSKGNYDLTDAVEMHAPVDVKITTRDRVTNIRNSRGEVVWREEDFGRMTPTIFDVLGVQPSLDAFGSITEWFILLGRSEIQNRSGVEGGS